jgi:hypothetical protein
VTFLHELACSLSELSTEVHKLDNKVRDELPVWETKAFFMFRHFEVPGFMAPVQQAVIREWEPRIPKHLEPLTPQEYTRLRSWLGIGNSGLKFPEYTEKEDKILRTESSYSSDNCTCGCEDYYDDDEDDY